MLKIHLRHSLASALVVLAAIVTPPAPVAAQNIALNKSAFQLSTGVGGVASRAVDGNTDGNYNNGSVMQTAFEAQPWWYVDLGATYTIGSITIWNRTDLQSQRLKDFNVSVLADGSTDIGGIGTPTVWTQFFSGVAATSQLFSPTANTNGRYVKIQLTGMDVLHFAEVQVTEGIPSQQDPRTTVPEPGTTALLAAGLAVLGVMGRRRRITAA